MGHIKIEYNKTEECKKYDIMKEFRIEPNRKRM